ncbi:hypothetical protein Zmor_014720 [Zophobas morio]|uniref:Uncharacterized protein n=1 Tax=Zophobas morio TaxID=2755281 RepID=A0AA38MGQ1_9CUCU|nr:hypothetical protein Zmor_014720 [Zophobas morio]
MFESRAPGTCSFSARHPHTSRPGTDRTRNVCISHFLSAACFHGGPTFACLVHFSLKFYLFMCPANCVLCEITVVVRTRVPWSCPESATLSKVSPADSGCD